MTTTRPPLRSVTGPLLVALLLLGTALAQDDLPAGMRIYNETAGGVGCAYCHGLDGRGQGVAGMDAPNILGAQMPAIRSSLSGGVPAMGFIELNERELAAVAAYVALLSQPEPAEPAEPAPSTPEDGAQADDARHLTINVEITAEGFRPAEIEIPIDRTVQLVVRNRTDDEHHYRIVGLTPRNLLWIADPIETAERVDGVSDDEHEAHHSTSYVNWRAPSPAGVQPNGDEVHAWTYRYSPGGGMDVLLFQATEVGSFEVVDPLEPTFRGTVTVY